MRRDIRIDTWRGFALILITLGVVGLFFYDLTTLIKGDISKGILSALGSLLILWVLPPFLAVALAIIVWVSGRMKSTAASQQAASLVSLPVILLAYGVAGGVVANPQRGALIIGAVAWSVAIAALVAGAKAFDRERLLGFGG